MSPASFVCLRKQEYADDWVPPTPTCIKTPHWEVPLSELRATQCAKSSSQEPGTKSITWNVTEEQAHSALKIQSEDSNYHTVGYNCVDRARDVLKAADIEVPEKDGLASLPAKVGKWIDKKNQETAEK